MSRSQLEEAYQLIKDGKRLQAESILQPIVDEDENNADAWWLLANARKDPQEQRQALYHVLRLRPDHAKAQKMLADIDAVHLPSVEELAASPFDMEYEEDRIRVTKPAGSNRTLYIVLAVLAFIAVIGCAACFLITSGLTVVVEEAMNEPQFAEIFEMLEDEVQHERLGTRSFDMQGVIEPGQTVTETLDRDEAHGWTFTGSARDPMVIELKAAGSTLDPKVWLYGPDDRLLGSNDDVGSGGGTNSLLELTLPVNSAVTDPMNSQCAADRCLAHFEERP